MPSTRSFVVECGLLMLGSAALAFGVSTLIVPARLADGGIMGLAVVLHYVTHLPVGPLFLTLNVPLLAWAWLAQGPRFLWRTIVGVLLISGWTWLLAPVHIQVGDRLLAALYGGLLVGAGIGLLLRGGGSSGGSDILARHLYRARGVSYSVTYLATDLLVLSAVAVWVGLDAAMYAWIATNVASRVVTYVVEGPRRGRVALVVSRALDQVAERVARELQRGATRLEAQGTFTGQQRPLLMVALGPQQVTPLRHIVAEEDPHAFMVVLSASEVLGEGFFQLEDP